LPGQSMGNRSECQRQCSPSSPLLWAPILGYWSSDLVGVRRPEWGGRCYDRKAGRVIRQIRKKLISIPKDNRRIEREGMTGAGIPPERTLQPEARPGGIFPQLLVLLESLRVFRSVAQPASLLASSGESTDLLTGVSSHLTDNPSFIEMTLCLSTHTLCFSLHRQPGNLILLRDDLPSPVDPGYYPYGRAAANDQ